MSATDLIERLIPHRAPFRFVDEWVDVDAHGGHFRLHLDKDTPRFWSDPIAPTLLLEALAQSAAAYHGAQRERAGEKEPERGFLVQIDRAHMHPRPLTREPVDLRVKKVRALGGLVLFSGSASQGEHELARARFTVARDEEGRQ